MSRHVQTCHPDHFIAMVGNGIAFVDQSVHEGLLPRILRSLLAQRRAVKARMKQMLGEGSSGLVGVLDARQLTLKLLANASYGFCGADTSHLCCKPLAGTPGWVYLDWVPGSGGAGAPGPSGLLVWAAGRPNLSSSPSAESCCGGGSVEASFIIALC